MINKEFKSLVDELLERMSKLRLKDYAEAKSIITEFKRLGRYSKNKNLLEDIGNIEYRFLSKNEKIWNFAVNDLESIIGDVIFIPLYSE